MVKCRSISVMEEWKRCISSRDDLDSLDLASRTRGLSKCPLRYFSLVFLWQLLSLIRQHFCNTVILWLLDWNQSKKLLVCYWIYLASSGTALVALRNLGCLHQTRAVAGIGNQIAKVLGDAGVDQVALMGRHEIIFLDRSVEYLLKIMALFAELQIKSNTVVYLYWIFQLPITYPSPEEDTAPHEDAVPAAMTTRLRRQSERERERELRELRIRKIPESIDLLPVVQADPSVWTVDEVWAFIHSLPGM